MVDTTTNDNAQLWNTKQVTNFDADSKSATENFTAFAGQTNFQITTFSYTPNTQSLTVYAEEGGAGTGLTFLQPGEQWIEKGPNAFSVLISLEAGARVSAVGHIAVENPAPPAELPTDFLITRHSTDIAALSSINIIEGYTIQSLYYANNELSKSGALFRHTGTADLGKAGDVPNLDGFFYDADGKQFELMGDFPNVKQFGAVGDDVANDYLPMQTGINFVSRDPTWSGLLYVPGTTAAYNITQALVHSVGHGFSLVGDGRTSKISNVTAGNTLELGIEAGDSSTQYNQARVSGIMLSNGVVGGTAVFARWRPDLRFFDCVFEGYAVDGFGIRIEETIACIVLNSTSQSTRNIAFSVTERSHGFTLDNCRCDGNGNSLELPQIGLYVKGSSNINVKGGTVLESYPGAAILIDADCSAIHIQGSYYEDNATVGLTFTGTGARTIKADIVISGGSFPALSSATPVQGVTVEGNYFEPDNTLPIDSTIYLIAVQGFEEHSNVVNSAYTGTPGATSFIKTFLDSAIYQADNVVLGQSHIEGAPVDKYFDMENLNVTTTPNNYTPFPTTLQIPEVHAPRFNAFEDGRFQPEQFTVQIAGSTTISQVLAAELRQGQYCYDVTKVAAGTSDTEGAGPILEANYDDYWNDTIWVAYAEAKAVTNTPGLELLVHVAGLGATLSGNGEALTTSWTPRVVLMEPQAGSDITYIGWRMSVGSGGDVARVTRPIFCPLGALQDILGKTVIIDLEGSTTWDPIDLAAGLQTTQTISVPGARVGDYVIASFSNQLQELTLSASVTADNTVTAILYNGTAGNVNLASGTIKAKAIRI